MGSYPLLMTWLPSAKAEQRGQIPLIAQSNAMRKAAKEKEQELTDVQKKLDLKLNEIKN